MHTHVRRVRRVCSVDATEGFLVRRSGDGLIEAELGPTNCRLGGVSSDWNVSRHLTLGNRRLRVQGFPISPVRGSRFIAW